MAEQKSDTETFRATTASLAALSEVWKSPSKLAADASGLRFASDLSPGECNSDEDPPAWDMRDESWTIDGLLGSYEASMQSLTIFNKGICFVASQFKVRPELLEMIVRLHEWGHAIFHLGLPQAQRAATGSLASMDSLRVLTEIYQGVDHSLHEQIAQCITKIALDDLRVGATWDQSVRVCDEMIVIFGALMQRQPDAYRLDHLMNLKTEELRSRLHKFIMLLRRGAVKSDRETWNTIIAW